jgi:8-oxo-dGTP pyrophosphatase MutT (NUDIX family)
VAPKGKIQIGETEKDAAIRELSEEVGIRKEYLIVKQLLGTTSLRSSETKKGHLDKDVTYFLMKYTGEPAAIRLIEGEGYIGIYKWLTIQEVLNLIYYEDIRELVRKSYFLIKEAQKNQSVKQDFLNTLK